METTLHFSKKTNKFGG